MSTIFISHSSKDAQLLETIKKELDTYSISYYIAEEDLKAGESLPKKIEQNIDSATVVIAVLTADSSRSPSVNQEIGYAKSKGKLIIPLKEENASVGVLLQGIEYIPLSTRDIAASMEKMGVYINNLINGHKIEAIIGGIILLILIAVLLYFSLDNKG